jgi:hypothetical protein
VVSRARQGGIGRLLSIYKNRVKISRHFSPLKGSPAFPKKTISSGKKTLL